MVRHLHEMEIINSTKPAHPYCYLVQKLTRGDWKTVAHFWSLDLATLEADSRAKIEFERYRVLRIDTCIINEYQYVK